MDGFVIGRNALFLFTALMESEETFDLIAIGVHAGTQYYDCSDSFLKLMQALFDGAKRAAVSNWSSRTKRATRGGSCSTFRRA